MRIRDGLMLMAVLPLAMLTSCSAMKPQNQPVNCNVVKEDRQAGQQVTDIAAAFGVTEAEIEKCGTGPLNVPGAEQSEGATEAGAAAGASGGGEGGGEAGSGGGDSGAAAPSGDTGAAPSGKPAM